jgi:outer membrane usher protein FimD/PapC
MNHTLCTVRNFTLPNLQEKILKKKTETDLWKRHRIIDSTFSKNQNSFLRNGKLQAPLYYIQYHRITSNNMQSALGYQNTSETSSYRTNAHQQSNILPILNMAWNPVKLKSRQTSTFIISVPPGKPLK